MSKSVNVDFVTRQIEVDTDGKEHFISAAMAAKDAEQSMVNAQNAAISVHKYKALWFESVASMKAEPSLTAGAYVCTAGYYAPNDGGGASYLIRTKADADIDDGGSINELRNGLVAELIVENNTYNIRQLGATPDKDLKPYIDLYLAKCATERIRPNLYIPSAVWKTSGIILTALRGFNIFGEKCFGHAGYTAKGTVITAMNDNQDFVVKIGDKDFSSIATTTNFSIKDICVSSGIYDDNYNITTSRYSIADSALIIECASFGYVDLNFLAIKGTAFKIRESWEIYFGDLNFRWISDVTKPVMLFANVLNIFPGPNISAIEIKSLMFEGCDGSYIVTENSSGFCNSIIHYINAEMSFDEQGGWGNRTFDLSDSTKATKNLSAMVFNQAEGLQIGNINLQYLNGWKATDSQGNIYAYKNLIEIPENGFFVGSIGSITCSPYGKNAVIFKATNVNPRTKISINSVELYSDSNINAAENSLLDLSGMTDVRGISKLQRVKGWVFDNNTACYAIPAYEFAITETANISRNLFTDITSNNKNKVVVKRNSTANFPHLLALRNDGKHKAIVTVKGAESKTYTTGYYGTKNGAAYTPNKLITTTGEWEEVEFDLTMFDVGTLVYILDNTNYTSEDTQLIIDLVEFIRV